MKVKVTRAGMTSCPSCLSHFEVGAELQDAECPFCGIALKIALRGEPGASAMSLLRGSRSGLIVAALAGSLAFTGCSGEDNNGNNGSNNGTNNGASNNDTADMGDSEDMTIEREDMFEDPNNQDYALAPAKDQNASG